jgi:cephalosporin hydroxylase
MDPTALFRQECQARVQSYSTNGDLQNASDAFMNASSKAKYSYNFSWLGRPIIQYPQDIIAMQEIIWGVKPDLIIETGVAHGGSLIFYASMLELLGGVGRVIGVDIDIRKNNRKEIESHPMFRRISLIEGSSVDPATVQQVRRCCLDRRNVLVVLDSNHTHEHVLKELYLYALLVTRDSYCVVFDTVIEDVAAGTYSDRPWGKGNNPKTAVRQFLTDQESGVYSAKDSEGRVVRFAVDKSIEDKLMITVAPGGYLRRVE